MFDMEEYLKRGDTNVSMATAAYNNDVAGIREALEHRASVNMVARAKTASGNIGGYPLILAAGQNHVEALRELLAIPLVNINVADEMGNTALHVACEGGIVLDIQRRRECVRMLLNATSKQTKRTVPNRTDPNRRHPFLIAASPRIGDSIDGVLLRMLKDAGADINVLNAEKDTALLMAVKRGAPKDVRTLLDLGCDPEVGGPDGLPPLVVARLTGRFECADVITTFQAEREVKQGLVAASISDNNDIDCPRPPTKKPRVL